MSRDRNRQANSEYVLNAGKYGATILESREAAINAILLRLQIPESVNVTSTTFITDMDGNRTHIRVALNGMREATALAREVLCKSVETNGVHPRGMSGHGGIRDPRSAFLALAA